LAEQAAGGDKEAFERLVRLHERTVFRLAYNVCGNTHDAQDASQEVFLRLYHKIGTFRGESKFTTWLYRLAMNVSLNYKRRVVDRPAHVVGSFMRDDDGGRGEQIEIADAGAGPEQFALDAERAAILRRALDALPGEYREAFILREIAGLDYAQIGEVQGIGQGTVKSRLFRARERIREFLTKAGFGRY